MGCSSDGLGRALVFIGRIGGLGSFHVGRLGFWSTGSLVNGEFFSQWFGSCRGDSSGIVAMILYFISVFKIVDYDDKRFHDIIQWMVPYRKIIW